MSQLQEYYYSHQLKNYLIQFMAIFANLKVKVGKTGDLDSRFITVPVAIANKDRVVAAIKSENTQNKPIRLPMMSVRMASLDLAVERMKGTGLTRRQTFMPNGGVFPNDISVVEQKMPVPYNVLYELNIWTSNIDQMHQILEQILVLFDPQLQIQTNDEMFDWTKITSVELTGIRNEDNVPIGTDRRIIRHALEFKVPIWLSIPVEVHNRIVKDIYLRIAAVSGNLDNPEEILEELDGAGIPYLKTISLDDIDID